MGRIVYSGATSHVGAIMKNQGADPGKEAVLDAAWARMSEELDEAAPHAVVLVGTDHYETFGLQNYPTFCLGSAPRYDGWGENGTPTVVARGDEELSGHVLSGLIRQGFDLSRSHEMRLDHSFMTPLSRLESMQAPALLPLFVNCNTGPLPSSRRCYELGRALRLTVEQLRDDLRVAVVSTGGISHWVGLPQFGDINEEFDRQFLALIEAGDVQSVLSMSDEWVEATAGNGALELRTWMVAAGAAGEGANEVLGYAAMYPWTVGIGVVRFGRARS